MLIRKKILISILLASLALPVFAVFAYEVTDSLGVEAKAFVILDVKHDKILLSRNPEAQLPLASVTKLMTAYAARKSGLEDQNDKICYMLTVSSNELADEIGGKAGGEALANQYARELGLKQTFYLNPSGLDISTSLAGAYGSAIDQAHLISRVNAEYPEILNCTTETSATYDGQTKSNTNSSVDKIIGLTGSKTGFTDLAGGNLAISFDAGIDEPVVVVVLGSTEESREADVKILALKAIELMSQE